MFTCLNSEYLLFAWPSSCPLEILRLVGETDKRSTIIEQPGNARTEVWKMAKQQLDTFFIINDMYFNLTSQYGLISFFHQHEASNETTVYFIPKWNSWHSEAANHPQRPWNFNPSGLKSGWSFHIIKMHWLFWAEHFYHPFNLYDDYQNSSSLCYNDKTCNSPHH